jgi:V-type H+-transporting ATPase subunit C
MSKAGRYLLVSLPTSIVPSHHRDDALNAVSTTVSHENGSVASFPIPEFKIGTLDALVQQADELAKLENSCQAVVGKVGDALKNILEGDEAQIERMKVVNDSMCLEGRGIKTLIVLKLTMCRAGGSVFADVLVE